MDRAEKRRRESLRSADIDRGPDGPDSDGLSPDQQLIEEKGPPQLRSRRLQDPREPGPYEHFVPTDPLENVIWRRKVLAACRDDEEFARDIHEMCRQDAVFWLAGFAWTHDPRPILSEYDYGSGVVMVPSGSFSDDPEVPFIPFEAQKVACREIKYAIGRCDLGLEKSRDMGMTWLVLAMVTHEWLFERMASFLLISRTKELVEQIDDPDCLFWKVDFLLAWTSWPIRPPAEQISKRLFHRKNRETEAVIDGTATTKNMGRGGRRRAAFNDEMAAFEIQMGYKAYGSLQATTPCRLMGSTPQGVGNQYADAMRNPRLRKVVMHWSDHPCKRRGMYTSTDGALQIIDTEFDFPDNYPFQLDGKLRSPFYDLEDARTPIKALLAQEQDIDYLGSGSQFFRVDLLQRHLEKHKSAPWKRGELIADADPREWQWMENDGGRVYLWCDLAGPVGKEKPLRRRYVIGCDISTGTGASNSVATIGDLVERRVVACLAHPGLSPEAFALSVASMGYWFSDEEGQPAYIIWESNGPGLQFGKQIVALQYPAFYWRKKETDVVARVSTIPGYHTDGQGKRVLLGELARAWSLSEFIDPDELCFDEAQQYIFDTDGCPIHVGAKNPLDPSGAGFNHGDRVMSRGLTWKGMQELGVSGKKDDKPDRVEEGTLYHRRQRRLAVSNEPAGGWW